MSSTIKNLICKTCLILIIGFTFLAVSQAQAQPQTVELRVDGDNGLPGGDGLTWGTAFQFLQDALTRAEELVQDPNITVELWVAATDPTNPYVPDRDADNPDGTGDRNATFLLNFNNVTLLGGFLGNETDPDDRNPAVYITVLSGGIFSGECGDPLAGDCFEAHGSPSCDDLCNGAECPGCCEAVCEIDPLCCILDWNQGCADIALGICSPPLAGDPAKSYHVVTASGVDDTVRIDGFKITLGLADGGEGSTGRGAGMLIDNASPAVVRIIFTENAAPGHGGGAMNVTGTSDPLVVNCEFIANTGEEAGALHTEHGLAGGTFVNCLFSKNTSVIEGGAINPGANGNLNFINCTFVDNSVDNADGGGAISTETSQNGEVNLINCILWGNVAGEDPNQQPSQIDDPADVVSVTYSCVEGTLDPGWDDGDNINDDPMFVDAPKGDYRILIGSMVIDKGDPIIEGVIPDDIFDIDNDNDTLEPTPDLDLSNRVLDGDDNGEDRVDMGSYEFIHPNECPWDLDGGGFVGAGDLLLLLADWGNPYGAADLLDLLAAWGACPSQSFEPPSLQEELDDACLSSADWQEFLDAMANGTPAEQENYICWLTHYFEDCTRCICIGQSGCPGADPFDD